MFVKIKLMESFITEIVINSVRNILDFKIPLSKEERKHLIITGKNGSGKTTLLLELQRELGKLQSPMGGETYSQLAKMLQDAKEDKIQLKFPSVNEREIIIESYEKKIRNLPLHIKLTSLDQDIKSKVIRGNFILAFFNAKRQSYINKPSGIQKLTLERTTIAQSTAGSHFLQFIVNMIADRSFARDDGETETVKKIDDWFQNFENQLKFIFDVSHLQLKFDRHAYTFDIITDENNKFDFNTLSDGYSAIISIISDLIMRMEALTAKAYDLEGIVIIDEIETHLHIDLQKKILPFLISFFPKLQFVVTTHSPFVLTSLSNTVVCDLENRNIFDDLTQYSYEAIIESYFNADQYSEEIKRKIEKFEHLIKAVKRSREESSELSILREYFKKSPKYLSKELHSKLLELELFELTQNNGL